jgi:hypothetical protein
VFMFVFIFRSAMCIRQRLEVCLQKLCIVLMYLFGNLYYKVSFIEKSTIFFDIVIRLCKAK